jgi:hypothetical protein
MELCYYDRGQSWVRTVPRKDRSIMGRTSEGLWAPMASNYKSFLIHRDALTLSVREDVMLQIMLFFTCQHWFRTTYYSSDQSSHGPAHFLLARSANTRATNASRSACQMQLWRANVTHMLCECYANVVRMLRGWLMPRHVETLGRYIGNPKDGSLTQTMQAKHKWFFSGLVLTHHATILR